MRVFIDHDEWGPVTVYTDASDRTWQERGAVEVPDEIIAEYDAAKVAFDAAQAKLDGYMRK